MEQSVTKTLQVCACMLVTTTLRVCACMLVTTTLWVCACMFVSHNNSLSVCVQVSHDNSWWLWSYTYEKSIRRDTIKRVSSVIPSKEYLAWYQKMKLATTTLRVCACMLVTTTLDEYDRARQPQQLLLSVFLRVSHDNSCWVWSCELATTWLLE